MSKQSFDDGGPAFPVVCANGLGHLSDGMSLRDWFAAQAISAVWRAPNDHTVEAYEYAVKRAAGRAFDVADAMLAARTRRTELEG